MHTRVTPPYLRLHQMTDTFWWYEDDLIYVRYPDGKTEFFDPKKAPGRLEELKRKPDCIFDTFRNSPSHVDGAESF